MKNAGRKNGNHKIQAKTKHNELRTLVDRFVPERYIVILNDLRQSPKQRDFFERTYNLTAITVDRTLTELHKLGLAYICKWHYNRIEKRWCVYWALGSQSHAPKPQNCSTSSERKTRRAPRESMLDILRGSLF